MKLFIIGLLMLMALTQIAFAKCEIVGSRFPILICDQSQGVQ